MKNDERLLIILEQVVSLYVETGEPVGSAAICKNLKNSVSSATIRGDMAKLEKLGLLQQPHISSGRIPTYEGFRIYLTRLMKPGHLTIKEKQEIDSLLSSNLTSIETVVDNAVLALSELTGLAAVSATNSLEFSIISKVEVIPTGRRVFAVLIITSTGEIKNKICRVEFDINLEQLNMFKKLLSDSLVGNTIDSLNSEVVVNLSAAVGSYILSFSPLLKALNEISNEMQRQHVKLKGENNLLQYGGVQASEILNFISNKDRIVKILSAAYSGINVVFGNENDFFTIGNSSLIVKNFGGNDRKLGSFGVIGPVCLNYKKVMAYLNYFEHSLTGLINKLEFEQKLPDFSNFEEEEDD